MALAQYVAELERELSEMRSAMESQKREFDENASTLAQVMTRIAHSERTLGQAKAKLIAAEQRADQASTDAQALRKQLNEAETYLQKRLEQERKDHAEQERAQIEKCERAAAEVETHKSEMARLRDALGAALERERAFREVEAELRGELAANQRRSEQLSAERQQLRELAESLSRDSAAGASECARLAENQKLAEAREAKALIAAQTVRARLVVSSLQLNESRVQLDHATVQFGQAESRVEEMRSQRDEACSERDRLRTELAEVRAELASWRASHDEIGRREAELVIFAARSERDLVQAASEVTALHETIDRERIELGTAQRALVAANEECERLVGVIGAAETLAQGIIRLSLEAKEAGSTLPHTEHASSDEERVTIKPISPPKGSPPRSLRQSTAPEIVVDGVLMGS